MHLVQLGVTDTTGKEFDQHLIRLRIGEGNIINDQWCVRFNENGSLRARRHGVPLLERHVATASAMAQCMEYSGTSSVQCLSRYESYRHLEISTLPYMIVLGQVGMQLVRGVDQFAYRTQVCVQSVPGSRLVGVEGS